MLAISGCTQIKFDSTANFAVPKLRYMKKKNLALVLGGGGAKGFAHVGVIEELEKARIKPDAIIGCSAGSIVGVLYAANPDSKNLKEKVLNGKRADVIELNFMDWPYSIYGKNKLREYLYKNLNVKDFSELKIPFIASATDLKYGNLVGFNQGDLIDPIIASAAFPGAFAPVKINENYYVDCGVADPVPVRLAKALGFEKVIAVNIAEKLPVSSPKHALGILKRSLEIAYINQSRNAVENADVVIDFDFKNIGTFTDKYNEYLYREGKKAAKIAIPKIKKILDKN